MRNDKGLPVRLVTADADRVPTARGRVGQAVEWARRNKKRAAAWALGGLFALAVVSSVCSGVSDYLRHSGRPVTHTEQRWGPSGPVDVVVPGPGPGGSSDGSTGSDGGLTDQQWHAVLAFSGGVVVGLIGLANVVALVQLLVLLAFGLVLFLVNPNAGFFGVGVVVGGLLVRLLVRWLRDGRRRQNGAGLARRNTTFGSTKWATAAHLVNAKLILNPNPGYLLGFFQVDGQRYAITYSSYRHILTFAPTRGGKGVSAILPNLLTHLGSIVVIDPKGENARITAKRRAAMGQEVHVIDPFGITGLEVSRFNPLASLDPKSPRVADDAYMLADAMIVRSVGGGNSEFFDNEALSLLWGFILWVVLDPRFEGARHLGTVRDMMSLGNRRLFGMLNEMYQSPHRVVSSVAERAIAKDEETRANVFSSLQSHTVFLDSDAMRDTLSGTGKTFRFQDLKTKPMSVYLVLPADALDTYSRWLRLLIQQAITYNARNLGVQPVGGRPILFMLDELAALGNLSKVRQAWSLMAGFGMQLWGILQDVGQLEAIYGKGWETFIGNSGVVQYYGSMDGQSTSYFSKMCGMTTVEKRSLSRSIGQSLGISGGTSRSSTAAPGGGSSTYGTSHGTSDSVTTGTSETADVVQRPLVFPEELARMQDDQALLLVERFDPIDCRKVAWYDEPSLACLGENIQGKEATPLPAAPVVEVEPFVIPGTEGLSAIVDVTTGKPA